MRLFIAEKENQAEDIARVIAPEGLAPIRRDGCFLVGENDVVTWAMGHMYEQAKPEHYDPRFSNWKGSADLLPIVPEKWEILPIPSKKQQLDRINDLIGRADVIVHACDPDREGQLIGDEIIAKAPTIRDGVDIKRMWMHGLNAIRINEALEGMKPNKEYFGQTEAAMTRQRADWLVGMNLTRIYTIEAQKVGYGQKEMFVVGRVQTPTLALIVKRDREIAEFRPVPYFLVGAQMKHANGDVLASWKPKDGLEGIDKEGRVVRRELGDAVVGKIKGRSGYVTVNKKEEEENPPPLPFDLSSLQREANEKYKMTLAETLAAAQVLYERYKIISYPRSDCRYIPEDQHREATAVLHAISRNDPDKAIMCENASVDLRSKAWDNAKVVMSSHHAIIPLATIADVRRLEERERQVYDIICRAYIAQFYESAKYAARIVEYVIAGETFETRERRMTSPGWRVIYPPKTEESKDRPSVPEMEIGDRVSCIDVEVVQKMTQAPPPFNDARIAVAMKNIEKYVEEDSLKQQLAGCGGIGTAATRHEIIEKLIENNYVVRMNGNLVSTRLGREVIDAFKTVPAITSPGLTAIYEQVLQKIEKGESRGSTFIRRQAEIIKEMIAEATVPPRMPEEEDDGGGGENRKRRRGKRGRRDEEALTG